MNSPQPTSSSGDNFLRRPYSFTFEFETDQDAESWRAKGLDEELFEPIRRYLNNLHAPSDAVVVISDVCDPGIAMSRQPHCIRCRMGLYSTEIMWAFSWESPYTLRTRWYVCRDTEACKFRAAVRGEK